ncbi:hypothetical protein [Nonomuraea sp. NPDC049400]|uniref:hypothetical protein n=1 Tax=Nonomuraea sp. NPDC049400 TaxID=3364352 RepID=UPI00378DD569
MLHDTLASTVDQLGAVLPPPTPTPSGSNAVSGVGGGSGNTGGGFQLPDPPPAAPTGLTDYFSRFLGAGKWITGAVAALSLTGIAVKMTLGKSNRHHLAADGAASVPWVLVGLMLAMTAVSIVGFVVPAGSGN